MNTLSIDKTAPSTPATGSSDTVSSTPKVTASNDVCSRCGRSFRGEWDRHDTPVGVYCHICARLATADSPPIVDATTLQEKPAGEGSYFPMEPVETDEEEAKIPHFARNHPELFRAALWTAAIGMILLAILFAVFDVSNKPGPVTAESVAQEGPPIPLPLVWAIFFCIRMGALYAVLSLENRLPTDKLLANLIALLLPTLALMIPTLCIAAIPPVGLLGVFHALAGIMYFVISFWVLWLHFDCRWRAVFAFWLLHVVTMGFV